MDMSQIINMVGVQKYMLRIYLLMQKREPLIIFAHVKNHTYKV